MAKVNKTWKIHIDLDIGSTAAKRTFVENDAYCYVLELSFVKNRRLIKDLYELGGSFWLRFELESGELEYELVDIQGDTAQFVLPEELVAQSGEGVLYIEWRNSSGYIMNIQSPVEFNIIPSPWEVS